jgi:hypothetical protein
LQPQNNIGKQKKVRRRAAVQFEHGTGHQPCEDAKLPPLRLPTCMSLKFNQKKHPADSGSATKLTSFEWLSFGR